MLTVLVKASRAVILVALGILDTHELTALVKSGPCRPSDGPRDTPCARADGPRPPAGRVGRTW
eukprot:2082045-Prymnesium_polylepis.1